MKVSIIAEFIKRGSVERTHSLLLTPKQKENFSGEIRVGKSRTSTPSVDTRGQVVGAGHS